MELETPRLLLRQFRGDDLRAWAAICSEPGVMRYASMAGVPLTPEQSGAWLLAMLEHWQKNRYGMWAVEEKASGRLIGRIGLQRPPEFPGTEVAWMLGTEHWGSGYAAEGARAAMNHGFEHVGLPRLISLIFPDNVRSIRLAVRLGESYECDFHLAGRRLLLYSIRREEWHAGRSEVRSRSDSGDAPGPPEN